MGKMVEKATKKIGEVEMSRRNFLRLGFAVSFAAYESLDMACDVLNEITEPGPLDKIMNFLNFDFIDKMVVKGYLFDHKLSVLIKLSEKTGQFIDWLKK